MKHIGFLRFGLILAPVFLGAVMLGAPATTTAQTDHDYKGESVQLLLKIDGKAVEGESMGQKGAIECLSFKQSVTTAREAGSGMATGRRQYEPLRCTKPIDKSSPLLMKALTKGQRIDGTFKFYRQAPDGRSDQYYTIEIKNGRVASYSVEGGAMAPAQEELTFVFQTISWTYTNGGVTHEDTWSGGR